MGYVYVSINACVCASLCVLLCAYTCVGMCVRACVSMCACERVFTCMCLNIREYLSAFMYIFMCLYRRRCEIVWAVG